MRLLLDSHVFLWALNDSQKLGAKTTSLLLNPSNQPYISVATIWELGLKHLKGKLPYSIDELLAGVEALGLSTLSIETQDLQAFQTVELTHRDPFDSLLVAQAVAREMRFVTADANILASSYTVLDAGQ
ncbi:type II toxin-antitoxin system VapC family toxin [Candidatus Saccharibacteria bacterium]|mgnify:CR=1 FL=1|jgi:PIN domain nuclease of toxin-antitoxin system|nr:type II toxin-antitoxin system VapC family toxin [Candidatus Saccharibacteria bacterium]